MRLFGGGWPCRKRLMERGFRHAKCAILMCADRNRQSELDAFSMWHVGDILFEGSGDGLGQTESAIRTFRGVVSKYCMRERLLYSKGCFRGAPSSTHGVY